MKRALWILAVLLASALPVALPLHADHDDGDDVKEYRYVLRFDPKELSRFDGYVVVDGSDMDPTFEVSRRIDRSRDEKTSPADVSLVYAGAIPVTIEAIPGGGDLVAKVESWARSEAARSKDGFLSPEPDVIRKFEAAFSGEVHRLTYARSPLLKRMLGLARCKVHFLEDPGDRLRAVFEHVTLRYTAPRKARVVPTRYVLEYEGGASLELSPEKASRLTDAQCRGLLRPPDGKRAAARRFPEGLWGFGAPSFAAAMLGALAMRRRRGGA